MGVMEDANFYAIHAKRVTIMPRHSGSLPHLGRASKIPKSSSLQENLLVVGCVGFLFVFQYRGRELKWEEVLYLIWDLFLFTHFNPMVSCPFFHPAQVSWSDVLVLLVSFFCLAQVSQCNDF